MLNNDNQKMENLRKNLVEGIRLKGIYDSNVLEAIGRVKRHLFMNDDLIDYSYIDRPFPIGAGQTISQPYTVAFQTELLEIKKGEKVLEIGTGSGYQASVLLEMGADVYSIERQKNIYNRTSKFLPSIGYNAKLFYGDGYLGLPEYAPFDKIIITAAAPEMPKELIKQLKIDGIMVVPYGIEYQSMLRIIKKNDDDYKIENCGDFVFVPLLKGTAEDII